MNLDSIIQQALNIAGTFNLTLVVLLFSICVIGEFHIAVPYLLETVWLLAGYHVGSGALSPFALFLLWLAAQAGRQVGATALFYLTRLGSVSVSRIYQRRFGVSLAEQSAASNAIAFRFWRRLDYLSPLSVAAGRLFWLRIPLTLTLGVKRQLKPLCVGVLLSGLVWDGIYIVLGVIGGHTPLTREQMLLYSLAGLTLLYAVTVVARQLARAKRKLKA